MRANVSFQVIPIALYRSNFRLKCIQCVTSNKCKFDIFHVIQNQREYSTHIHQIDKIHCFKDMK